MIASKPDVRLHPKCSTKSRWLVALALPYASWQLLGSVLVHFPSWFTQYGTAANISFSDIVNILGSDGVVPRVMTAPQMSYSGRECGELFSRA